MSVTTVVCDGERHAECPGQGLIQGRLTPPHEPEAEGEMVWVTVRCGCPCHEDSILDALNRRGRRDDEEQA